MAEMREVDVTINEDRISKLPNNLIQSILERISIKEATRTSILSTKWRYIWTKIPKLVLDKQFVEGLTSYKRINPSKFVLVVDNILMLHNGPIHKFHIYIPFNQTPNMDRWILYLSRNGVKELTLLKDYIFDIQPYKLPSYIFSCDQLTYLELSNCVINTPLEFTGFCNLTDLYLSHSSLSANAGSLISTLPALVTLSLRHCTGVNNINSLPPNLSMFVLDNSDELQWQWFQSNSKLSDLQFENVDVQGENFELNHYLSNLPNLSILALDGFTLKIFAAGDFTEFPQLSHKLKTIRLTLMFGDLDQVSCAFCLLKSSSNLEQLEIIEASDFFDDRIEQHDLRHIVGLVDSDLKLNCLRSVKIRFFGGFKAELALIKLILSHSPILQQMEIMTYGMAADEELAILIQMMSFCRASAESKIIYNRSELLDI